MKRRKKEKKGVSPLFAATLLLVSMGVVGRSMLGGSDPVLGPAAGTVADADPAALQASEAADTETGVAWRDLLAEFGSYTRGSEVRHVFVAFEYPSSWTGPAPSTGDAPAVRWVGEDPPLLRLGVVMVSQGARRAVLGGKVLGIGDAIAGGAVTAIEPGFVTLDWSGRKLTYDLDAAAPREFRHELAQRQLEQAEGGGDEPSADGNGKDPAAGGSAQPGDVPGNERKEGDK